MNERTEEQKVTQEPIKVVLGGVVHEVKPLPIKLSRVWRAEVVNALATLPQYAKVTTDDADLFKVGLEAMLVNMPDLVVDLFFLYAKDLNKEEIEEVATDMELAKAFEAVIAIGFPLVTSLVGTMQTLSR